MKNSERESDMDDSEPGRAKQSAVVKWRYPYFYFVMTLVTVLLCLMLDRIGQAGLTFLVGPSGSLWTALVIFGDVFYEDVDDVPHMDTEALWTCLLFLGLWIAGYFLSFYAVGKNQVGFWFLFALFWFHVGFGNLAILVLSRI